MPRESTKAGNYRINSRLNSVISVRGERPPRCWVSCIQCWSTPSESNSQPLDRLGLAPIAPSSRQHLFKGAQSSRYSPTPRRLRSSQAHEHPRCPLGAPRHTPAAAPHFLQHPIGPTRSQRLHPCTQAGLHSKTPLPTPIRRLGSPCAPIPIANVEHPTGC